MAQIHIWVDTTQPLAGRVVSNEDTPAQPFEGWLQLLTILTKALQTPVAPPVTSPRETAP